MTQLYTRVRKNPSPNTSYLTSQCYCPACWVWVLWHMGCQAEAPLEYYPSTLSMGYQDSHKREMGIGKQSEKPEELASPSNFKWGHTIPSVARLNPRPNLLQALCCRHRGKPVSPHDFIDTSASLETWITRDLHAKNTYMPAALHTHVWFLEYHLRAQKMPLLVFFT